MSSALRIVNAALALICTLDAQAPAPQAPKERDLKVVRENSSLPPTAAPAKPTIPRGYAVVVGIAKYSKWPESELLYPERDAEAIYSTLISEEGGNFRAENVRRLIGDRATLADLKREIVEWLPSVAKEDDRVLIYFAGHGIVHDGKAYLAPADIDPKNIGGTAFPMDVLGEVMARKVKAKWKVLLTDSCHSGAITPPADAGTMNQALKTLDRSLFSLTASRDRELSREHPDWGGGHGIFTYYVVKGLDGAADENRDGIVNADELAEYVRREVRSATGGLQNPTSDRASFDPNMLLAFVPSGAEPGSPAAAQTGTLIFESNMDGVEVFLDGKSMGVANKNAPLRLPGLPPGVHTVKGVRMGYEPDGPREELVAPGQEATVSIKILIPRRRNKASVDAFDKGMDEYNKGSADHYKKAASYFAEALAADPKYSQAALYLARVHHLLFANDKARQYFKTAIETDPDYLEARNSYAGVLLDTGDLDEAIRQLNAVVQRDKKNAFAWRMLANVLCRKESFSESIEAARTAIKLNPENAEVHLFLADSLRLNNRYKESLPEYQAYLRLSDFDSKFAGKLNYYVLGYLAGLGKKKRANHEDLWKDLRSWAYFGLCDSERKLANFDQAIQNCQLALRYDPGDAYGHYALGLAFARKGEKEGAPELFATAGKHFRQMLYINPELEEAKHAKANLIEIDAYLKASR